MSNRIQGATGTPRPHPVYFPTMSNRIQGTTGTLRRHPVYFPTISNRIQGATGTLRRHPIYFPTKSNRIQGATGTLRHSLTNFLRSNLLSLSPTCLGDDSALFNIFQSKKVLLWTLKRTQIYVVFSRSLTVAFLWNYLKSQNAPLDGLRVACFLE